MKLLQINVTANWGSTGKIAEDIGRLAITQGWESWIAYGRGNPTSQSHLIRIGSDMDMRLHGIQSRLLDNHGLASRNATRKLISHIRDIGPDIIHLHNIHGYFLNYPLLFQHLKQWGGPVVWTLHDCWPFTGHCAYYDYSRCDRWKTQCHNCPQLRSYPASICRDRSRQNHTDKKTAFTNCPNLTFVPVSDWLRHELSQSFLGTYPAVTIHNGIDTSTFRPIQQDTINTDKKVILGVASVWDKRKGLDEFIKLRKLLPPQYTIILIGLSQDQISTLPDGITGIRRTESVDQLVALYNMADVFVNPTLEDNFPTTNLEALACGTPVITYDTGGSPEAIDKKKGYKIDYQDIDMMARKIKEACTQPIFSPADCRQRALDLYDKNKAFSEYIDLYKTLTK